VVADPDRGVIIGPGPDYTSWYRSASDAVAAMSNRLTDFQAAGGRLPSLGGGDIDFKRDLVNLQSFELQRVDDGVTGSANFDPSTDFNAWNQLRVYADNAHEVATMGCP
jgi:hypothetical protein